MIVSCIIVGLVIESWMHPACLPHKYSTTTNEGSSSLLYPAFGRPAPVRPHRIPDRIQLIFICVYIHDYKCRIQFNRRILHLEQPASVKALTESLIACKNLFWHIYSLTANAGSSAIVVSCISAARIKAFPMAFRNPAWPDYESLFASARLAISASKESFSAYTFLTMNADSSRIVVSCIFEAH